MPVSWYALALPARPPLVTDVAVNRCSVMLRMGAWDTCLPNARLAEGLGEEIAWLLWLLLCTSLCVQWEVTTDMRRADKEKQD